MTNISMQEFNMASIVFDPNTSSGPVIIMIGPRGTGKSWLIRDLLYFQQRVPAVTVISGTEEGNGFYGPLVPRKFVHNEYDSAIIQSVLLRAKKAIKAIKRERIASGRSTIDPRMLVVIDDCLYDDKWTRDVLMRCLFMNGRHWHLMVVIALQYSLGIPPILRANIDYVFLLRNNVRRDREKLYNNFAGMFHNFDAFCQVMDQCTSNYECLVIHNTSKSNNLFDQVFYYKAKPRPDFRLCAPELWIDNDQYESDDDEAEEEYDPSKASAKGGRGKGPKLNVNRVGASKNKASHW